MWTNGHLFWMVSTLDLDKYTKGHLSVSCVMSSFDGLNYNESKQNIARTVSALRYRVESII